MVLFACERIPAMGAPAATADLLHETREKAGCAHTTASSIGTFLDPNWQKSLGAHCIELLMLY
jgi:hypothetical protein